MRTVRPEAVALAERMAARRRTGFHPLTGEARAGWQLAALAAGYGVSGRWNQGGRPMPASIEGQAGWVLWELEGWAKPTKRREAARAG